MVLKKPYAFIIKHFRLIHLLILACLVFLLFVARDINDLFSSLQSSNTFIYAGAESYINNIVFVFLAIILFLSGIVFWLLRVKKKPTRLYFLLIVYCIVEIVLFAYVFSLLRVMQENLLESEQLILGRDISLLCTLPNYFFIVVCLIRGIGFNLKQFNFSKDIEELEIADKDSAEFEVLIGQNNYKYYRLIRRTLREIKYYILENKFAISIFVLGIGLFLAGYGVYYYNQHMKKISEQEATTVNGVTYSVNNAYITSKDYSGEVINERSKFVVVDLSFYNSTSSNKTIDLDQIVLLDGSIRYHPTLTKNQKFYDLGVPYNLNDPILPGERKEATLAFEIPKSTSTSNFTMRVLYGLDLTGKKVMSKYRQFNVKAKKIDEDKKVTQLNVNETINVNALDMNEFNLTIMGYQITDAYDNKYVVCQSEDNCKTLSNVIKPSSISSQTMLVVDYKGTMYGEAKFTKVFNTYNKIFEGYCTVKYVIYNKTYKEKARIVVNSDVEGKVFIMMDRKLTSASEIELIFDFRDKSFEIPLLNKNIV